MPNRPAQSLHVRALAARGGRRSEVWATCVIILSMLCVLTGCGGALPEARSDPLAEMRRAAAGSSDGEVVGRWMLGELVVPGGETKAVEKARARLDDLDPRPRGMYASLARAIDDEAHGRFRSAAAAYLDALAAARVSQSADAELVGWYAANHLLRLRSSVHGLWDRSHELVDLALRSPGRIGWRARGELVEWWTVDGLEAQRRTGEVGAASTLELSTRRYGCVEHARLAGPFGTMAPSDARKSFAPERPGPWPETFERDPRAGEEPRVLSVEQSGCQIAPAEATGGGIYYVETFVELTAPRDVIVAVQGAHALWVDDTRVLSRDPAEWGIWPRFGARVRLDAGRHRVLARISGAETSIRLLSPDGQPLDVKTSVDPRPPYAMVPPRRLPDPNALAPFMRALGVPSEPGAPIGQGGPSPNDPISRFLAAYLANVEGQADLATVLLQPLVEDVARATGVSLAAAAVYLESDPIFVEGDARDLAKDLRTKAASKDPALWWPLLWLALDEADKVGVEETVPKIAALADRFDEVPDIRKGLIALYGRLGWEAERIRAVEQAAKRFPDDVEILRDLLGVLDAEGRFDEADRLVARIRELDPTEEVALSRALARRDYARVVEELERLKGLSVEQRDIAARVADIMTRAGDSDESIEKLEQALARAPEDAGARLDLADARFAAGDEGALRRALVDAIQNGSDTGALREAIELVEGATELTPFRRDPVEVVRRYEESGAARIAEAPADPEAPSAPAGADGEAGTASRVLDYAVLWVKSDGSARMLEHEILHMRTREAIAEHAEQQVPNGQVLRMRTIKRDGTILEPEFVQGKPTVTMPHLEVGDYIETETIYSLRGDGQGGRRFLGPRWFFREEKLAYWWSEFVVVTPKDRELVVEVTGTVPSPTVKEEGALTVRSWLVQESPALPEEPGSAPIQEFLPSVRVGWGVTLKDTVDQMVQAAEDLTPRDPRLVRVAESMAIGPDQTEAGRRPETAAERRRVLARISTDEKAKRIYRWVVANVEPSRESDGRRIVTSKSGNRTQAFLYLCRILGIDAKLGAVRSRLTPPPRGPFTEAEQFSQIAVRLALDPREGAGSGAARWMVVQDKFAPYGYLPSSLRGQPAIVLEPGAPREVTPTTGRASGVTHEGTVVLAADGSAQIELTQRYEGELAIQLRSALETLPDAQLKDTIEARLLPQALPGARLRSIEVVDLEDLDAPLTLVMSIEMSSFATVREGELWLSPPFRVNLGNLTSLAKRETPLYISEGLATRSEVKLRVELPKGARVLTPLEPVTLASAESSSGGGASVARVEVKDRLVGAKKPGTGVASGEALLLDRVVDLPAGRIQPSEYPRFVEFATRADELTHRPITIARP